MTTTTQHTAASLAAIHSRNPRELDAIAHRTVFPGKNTMWVSPTKFVLVDRVGYDWEAYPSYSTDLNHAALLEKALSERKINNDEHLFYVVRGNRNTNFDDDSWTFAGLMAHASARDRTIAAVLAAQSQQEAK